MTCWIVVPIKAPEACKTRLAVVVPDAARRRLVADMLRHVIETAQGAGEVRLMGPSRHGLPETVGLLADPGGGLNAALVAALAAAQAAGATRLVILAGDLPRLSHADVEGLADLEPGVLAVAPDRAGDGTNALSLPLPQAQSFHFHYGPDSFARHCAEAWTSTGRKTSPPSDGGDIASAITPDPR
jgi:2-phospho-L-lactate guanylyltransferase